MKTLFRLVLIAITCSVLPCSMLGQFSETSFPCIPPEMRRIIAMDMTSSIGSVVVGVGDGVLTAFPGKPFSDLTNKYPEKIFDGVACISPSLGLASTDDGIIVALDIEQRRESIEVGFPIAGRSLIRCDTTAFAIQDGGVIRIRRSSTGNFVVDTILSADHDVTLLSSVNAKRFLAYARATKEVLLISSGGGPALVRSTLDRDPSLLQSLSDSIAVILVLDTLLVGDTEIPRRPLRALWLHSGISKDLYGYDGRASELPVARFAASFLGGGAVVVPPGANNKSNAMIYFARGAEIDSVMRPAVTLPYFRNATAGVAWWYTITAEPVWTFSGGTVLTAEVDTSGKTITTSGTFREHATFPSGTWESARAEGESLIVTFASMDIPGQNPGSNWVIGWSVDRGDSWLQRPVPARFVRWDVDDAGRIIAATDTKIVKTSIYTSGVQTIYNHEGKKQIGAVHIHADTMMVVVADSLLRSVDGGTTWTSSQPPGFTSGLDVYANGRTLILLGRDTSSITTDCGASWRSFLFRTNETVGSCVVLSDTSVLGSWDNSGTGVISRSDGRLTSVGGQGVLRMFGADLVYYGRSLGMRAFNNKLNRLEADTVFRVDPYQRSTQWNVDPFKTTQRYAFGNDMDNAYFILGSRMKRITKIGPTSVARESIAGTSTIFPNPATSTLTIPAGAVSVRTMLGQLVWQGESETTTTIDVSRWQSGTYIAETKTGRQLVIVSR